MSDRPYLLVVVGPNGSGKSSIIRSIIDELPEDPAINIRRVAKRVSQGGHGVDNQRVIQRYYRTMDFLPQYLGACDTALVIDNSVDDALFQVLLTSESGEVLITEAGKKSPWLKAYYLDKQ